MSTTAKPKATYYYKLFRVKRSDGRVTTVSVDPILVTRACQVMGGLRSVSKAVRDAAFEYEDGMFKSCSGYVSEKLRKEVAAGAAARRSAQAGAATSANPVPVTA